MPIPQAKPAIRSPSQEGFGLVGLIVVIFIILLTLSVAAPTVARALRREREDETAHRANEYVNAIRRYHIKTGAYPGSLEQLEKTNNVRYLRQKYNDPMTGKPDWRLIKVGENKTTVKGFFGQPLAGLASPGIGGSALSPSGTPSSGAGAFGSPSGSTGANGTAGGSGASSGDSTAFGAGASTGGTSFGGPASNGIAGSPSGAGSTSGGFGSQSGSSFSGSGAPFLGVGLPIDGASILVVNEKTNYPEWEFLYDPRIEQLKAKVNILGGGMSSSSPSSLGALSGSASTGPGGSTPAQPTPNPTSP